MFLFSVVDHPARLPKPRHLKLRAGQASRVAAPLIATNVDCWVMVFLVITTEGDNIYQIPNADDGIKAFIFVA